MIKRSFLTKQTERSLRERRTSPFLRRLAFQVVDAEAREHYGDTYPMRCFQCSAATGAVLREFGIGSRLLAGAVCVAQVGERKPPRWAGFWDQDHHVWLMTDFGELVDLSVGVLHRHPAAGGPDDLPNLPLWWTDPGTWPPVIRYLPDTEVHDLGDPDDAADLRLFERQVLARLAGMLRDGTVDDATFGPILDGLDTLNAMTKAGAPWASQAFLMQRHGVPLPPWVRAREAELMNAWASRRSPTSRLGDVPGVLGTS